MAQPFVLAFGPWLPDGADAAFSMTFQYQATPIPLADVLNVYFSQGAYRSLPTFAASAGGALGAQALAAVTTLSGTGSPIIVAGDASDLFQWTGSAWSNASSAAGTYAGAAHWSFARLGECLLATDGVHALQSLTLGDPSFAAVAGAPIGNVLGVINQSVLVGSLTGYPYRVQWGAIGQPTVFPTPLTNDALANQAGQSDLDQDFGEVMFIGGGPQVGVILQRNGVTRATYTGGDVVFNFLPIERKRGLIARGAAVQAGSVTHYISDDGFWMTDGSASQNTGSSRSAQCNKWFLDNVNWNAVSAIRAAWDATLKNVLYAIPTGTNTLPDTLLLLHPESGYWTKAAIPVECLWTDNDGTRLRVGLFSQAHALGYLTGATQSGYCETYDLAFTDQQTRYLSEALPHIQCTDSPTMRAAGKEALDDALIYTPDAARDPFTRTCAFDTLPGGRFVRTRLTSSAASAFQGATLYLEQGGGI